MISSSSSDNLIETLAQSGLHGAPLRRRAMELLDELPNYDWCGIYRLEEETLILDEYIGTATDHTRIDVGVGVCGTAVAENANQVIDDVRELSNYLSCSIDTRSEIVVLIRQGETVLGQIDIDGHTVRAFDSTDEAFLERLAKLLTDNWD